METLHSIFSKSYHEYISYIERIAINNQDTLANELDCEAGHSFYKHCKPHEGEVAAKVIKEGKSYSYFTKEEFLNFYLSDAILYKSKEIADWLLKSKDLVYEGTLDFGKVIGLGFKNENGYLHKCKTTELTFILGRSHDFYSQTGFYLRTMYPNIESINTELIIDNLGPIRDINIDEIKDLEKYGAEFVVPDYWEEDIDNEDLDEFDF